MTLNRLQITTKKLKQADPHFVHSQPGIPLKETQCHIVQQMSMRHKGAGDWPFCGPEPRSASSLCSLPGPVQFDGLRFRGQTTASGNSWAVGTLVMSLVRSRNCLERWEENVFEDLRQCSTTLQKGAFLYLLLSQISAEKGPALATFLTQVKTCHCLPVQPPRPSFHLLLRRVHCNIIYTQ